MFIVIQYPMADLRLVLRDGGGRLARPDWNHGGANQQAFVRNFGRFGVRQAGGVDGMAGEGVTAEFNSAARFNGPIHCEHSSSKEVHPLRVWFRRLYFDGQVTGRFEIGLLTDAFWQRRQRGQSKEVTMDVDDLCRTLDGTEITIRGEGMEPVKMPLLKACDALTLAYLAATTNHGMMSKFPPAENAGAAVSTGDPLIYVRCPSDERLVIPKHARTIPLGSPGFSEMKCLVSMGRSVRVPVWIRYSSGSAEDAEPRAERNLRVMLSRLNAESFALGHLTRAFSGDSSRLDVDPRRADELEALIRVALGDPPGETDDPEQRKKVHPNLQQADTIFRTLLPGAKEETLRNLKRLSEEREKAKNQKTFLQAAKAFAASFVETAEKTAVEFWLKKATGA